MSGEHRRKAEAFARAADNYGGGDYESTADVQLHRINLSLQGLLHAVLALQPERPAPAVPADRALYRDRDGDLWMCAPDGEPHVLEPERDRRKAGHVWHGAIPGVVDILARVEQEHGPLHVVPWPGEVQ